MAVSAAAGRYPIFSAMDELIGWGSATILLVTLIVPRLYAAGDVVCGLNQVVVAAAERAIAATDIHNKLRTERETGRV